MGSLGAFNNWIANNRASTNGEQAYSSTYTNSTYIEGDFTAALTYFIKRAQDYDQYYTRGEKNPYYNFASDNCTQEVLFGISKGYVYHGASALTYMYDVYSNPVASVDRPGSVHLIPNDNADAIQIDLIFIIMHLHMMIIGNKLMIDCLRKSIECGKVHIQYQD